MDILFRTRCEIKNEIELQSAAKFDKRISDEEFGNYKISGRVIRSPEACMDILQLIDRLEELFNESKSIPLTRNVMVDEDRMLDIIDQMRIAIPEEVKKAQQLLGQRDRVLAQAQEEANRTLELARQKADQLVSKDMVMQEGQRRADQLLIQARAEADTIRADADDYVIDSLTQLQAELERITNQVNNGIRSVRDDQARRTPASSPVSQPVDKE
jgi:hypothetical protein